VTRRAFWGGAIAASVVATGYTVVRPPLGLWPSLRELSADFRTAKGEQRKVQLSSDVSVQLNTQTSISVRSTDSQPRIELISGEVSAMTRSPFVVLAGRGQARAMDARFDVQSLGEVISVSCLDGAVDVEFGTRSARLQAGQQLSYSGAMFGTPTAFDPDQLTAWQSGLLVFRNQSLTTVVEEINRYRPGRIVVVSADLRRRLVNGRFQIDKLDNFIAQVEELFGATATALPGGVVILS
jgi:transmembrane sensor